MLSLFLITFAFGLAVIAVFTILFLLLYFTRGRDDPDRCNFTPPTPGYAPCTRDAGHDGPCAHPLKESA